MKSTPLKSLLAGAALLAGSAALADSSISVPAFDAKIATARTSSSPEGATVNRSEARNAASEFWYDDWMVDGGEQSYLEAVLEDSDFLTGLSSSAERYLRDFNELNDAGDIAQLDLARVTTPASQLFGASGPLAWSSRIAEGPISGPGVANNDTMLYAYAYVLADTGAYEYLDWFDPIDSQELRQVLSGSANGQTPSQAEVDGAVAYLTQIGGGTRLYVGSWHSYLWGGESAGYVVASVSTDRRFVRMVRVISWGD
jgi:hypothetical protein